MNHNERIELEEWCLDTLNGREPKASATRAAELGMLLISDHTGMEQQIWEEQELAEMLDDERRGK